MTDFIKYWFIGWAITVAYESMFAKDFKALSLPVTIQVVFTNMIIWPLSLMFNFIKLVTPPEINAFIEEEVRKEMEAKLKEELEDDD